MREEHLGYRETAERFHIRHGRVQDWERIYLTEGPEGFSVERRGRGSKGRPKQLPKEVEEDLKRIERIYYRHTAFDPEYMNQNSFGKKEAQYDE